MANWICREKALGKFFVAHRSRVELVEQVDEFFAHGCEESGSERELQGTGR